MASRTELQGTRGVLRTSLLQEGAGAQLYTEGDGWRSVDSDWHRQNGYPQELAHFLDIQE